MKNESAVAVPATNLTANTVLPPIKSTFTAFPKATDFDLPSPSPAPQKPLLNIWQIPANLRCPVVGTCLTDEEVKKILKKTGCKVRGMTSFQLHSEVMGALYEENRLSRKVNSTLRHKYRKSIKEFADLGESEFMDAWRKRLKSGYFDDLFYVSALKSDLSDASSLKIYGEIHMMGHAHTREIMRIKKSLAAEKKEKQVLWDRLNMEKEERKKAKNALSGAEADLKSAYARITKLGGDCARLRHQQELYDANTENAALQEKLDKQDLEKRRMGKKIRLLEREKRKLQIKLFELRSANEHLAEEAKELIAQFSQASSCREVMCSKSCPAYSLCAKRVLIVGGLTRIKHLYRELVETGGGKFDYHDGYMKNAKRNIEAKVLRSDVVICPVNCNSHGACERVKLLCKKHNKPIKMLPSSSLSAISTALYSSN